MGDVQQDRDGCVESLIFGEKNLLPSDEKLSCTSPLPSYTIQTENSLAEEGSG